MSSTSFWSRWLKPWLARPRANTAARAQPPAKTPSSHSGYKAKLQGVIQSVLLRHDLLSSAYKFKVLALDHAGTRFIVLIETLQPLGNPGCHIEKELQDQAQEELQVQIKSVYWRTPATEPAAAQPPTQVVQQVEKHLDQRWAGAHASHARDFAPTQPLDPKDG